MRVKSRKIFSAFLFYLYTPDITLNQDYAALTGYTQEEVAQYFGDYLSKIETQLNLSHEGLLETIRVWYNGYVTLVYNPYRTHTGHTIKDLNQAFVFKDLPQVKKILNALLADLPSETFEKQREGLYHGLVHLVFRNGLEIRCKILGELFFE